VKFLALPIIRQKNDEDALDKIRFILDKMGDQEKAGFNRSISYPPKENEKKIYGILPRNRTKPYNINKIISCLVDKSEFEEYKKDYGKSIVCGYARVDGWAVGIVANQREIIKNKKGETQFGGVIYSDSADKSTRFIANCNQKKNTFSFPARCYWFHGRL
jgi:acetyl-CoA carboxylase carboxyltransferase component